MRKKYQFVFATIEEALEELRQGKMLILIDDEDRENEGDFIMAAEKVTPEAVNFMTKYGRGLVCVAITAERAEHLKLTTMVSENTALHGTSFTVTVDAVEGTSTGTSAQDRAITIQKIVEERTRPEELARPGHIFPLIAARDGVLRRRGHTEAVVDLARLAGMRPAGVLCEILDEDGSMARLPRLIEIAKKFNLKIITIDDLVKYRRCREIHMRQVTDVDLPTDFGNFRLFLYENILNPDDHHLAIVKGNISTEDPVLVRVHSECFTGDTLHSMRCDCGAQLEFSLKSIEKEGRGVVIYLRQEGRGIGLPNKILAYRLQDEGKDTVEANEALGFKADLREYWMAAHILKDMGVREVRLMTNNPRKVQELENCGLKVVERIPVMVPPNPINERYLRTKKEKLGHLLIFDSHHKP